MDGEQQRRDGDALLPAGGGEVEAGEEALKTALSIVTEWDIEDDLETSNASGNRDHLVTMIASYLVTIGNLRRERDALAKRAEELQDNIIRRDARRFSRIDPEKRDAATFVELLRAGYTWSGGRPVISAELASQLPCPYVAEADRWVPSAERLPENDAVVLLWWSNGEPSLGWWTGTGFTTYTITPAEATTKSVTHWRPIVGPPTADATTAGGEKGVR